MVGLVYTLATMRHARLRLFLLLFATSISAASQDGVSAAIDSLPSIKRVDQAAISPDGSHVAYIVDGQLSIAKIGDATSQTITTDSKASVRDVSWSSDSRQITWLSDVSGDAPSAGLWSASIDGSGLTKVADFKGYAQGPQFSPDGSKIAVLFIENMPRVAGPLQPMTPLAGVVGETVYEQRIAVVDVSSKQISQITPPDVYVYEYDWTPDSKGWVVSAAHGSGDNNWWIARL